jgi:integrase
MREPYKYLRKEIWWVGYVDLDGSSKQRTTGCRVHEEKKAEGVRLHIKRELVARAAVVGKSGGPLTVRAWAKTWIETRKLRGIVTAEDYEARLNRYVLPVIGDLRIEEVTPEHISSVLATLPSPTLAPRTIRHIYFTMHAMFRKAVPRLIAINPCSIDTEDLPAKIDKNPEWRATAVFSKDELVKILTAPGIPEDRRACYSLLFLAALRFGESAALRWRHYDDALRPLGRLVVAHSYSTRRKKEKSVKTENPRWVPVHPALAERLADWRENGWPLLMGRVPGPDDLIVPSRRGRNRSANHMLKKFHQDLERAGLRARRQHDARRTFISLAIADGARKDVLRWVTHGPEGDIVDLYTTLPWHALCEEVARLKIDLAPAQEAEVIELAKYANSRERHLQSTYTAEKAKSNPIVNLRGGRDLNPRPPA